MFHSSELHKQQLAARLREALLTELGAGTQVFITSTTPLSDSGRRSRVLYEILAVHDWPSPPKNGSKIWKILKPQIQLSTLNFLSTINALIALNHFTSGQHRIFKSFRGIPYVMTQPFPFFNAFIRFKLGHLGLIYNWFQRWLIFLIKKYLLLLSKIHVNK